MTLVPGNHRLSGFVKCASGARAGTKAGFSERAHVLYGSRITVRLEGTGLQVWETLPLYRLDAEDCWERTPTG